MAHVRSEATGAWWRYDDSEVTRIAAGPAGEHADHGTAAEKKVRNWCCLLGPIPCSQQAVLKASMPITAPPPRQSARLTCHRT